MREIGELSNLRVLIVDDQEEIHQDFMEMLQDGSAPMASDQAAADFGGGGDRTLLRAAQVRFAARPQWRGSGSYRR